MTLPTPARRPHGPPELARNCLEDFSQLLGVHRLFNRPALNHVLYLTSL